LTKLACWPKDKNTIKKVLLDLDECCLLTIFCLLLDAQTLRFYRRVIDMPFQETY